MLPVQDVIPSRTMPWVTVALVAALAGTFVIELLLPEPAARSLILSYGLVPAHLSWLSSLTALFLHYGALDAATNALALWIFGDNVEDRLGRRRFLAFVLIVGALSGVALSWIVPDETRPILGAGGAVGAVIGVYLVLFPTSRVLVLVPVWRGVDLVEIPAAILLGFWILLVSLAAGPHATSGAGVPLTLVPQIAGLAIGAASARLVRRDDRVRCEWWNVPVDHSAPVLRRTSRETSANSVSSASN